MTLSITMTGIICFILFNYNNFYFYFGISTCGSVVTVGPWGGEGKEDVEGRQRKEEMRPFLRKSVATRLARTRFC